MSEKIVELGAHEPIVESVISRLGRFEDRITHITAVIEWNDGSSDIYHDTKDIPQLCYESELLKIYVAGFIEDIGNE